MNRSKSLGISLLVFLLSMFSFSCNKNEVIIDGGGGGLNVPSYASTLNAFSYSINAQRLIDTQVIPLTFNKNRLQNAVAVSNVTSGRAIFAILDQANVIIHADTFKLPGMYRALMITGLPVSISITFHDFTGSISYALVGDTTISEFNLSDFPNTRGSQWTYFLYDSLARQSDYTYRHCVRTNDAAGKYCCYHLAVRVSRSNRYDVCECSARHCSILSGHKFLVG